jgi:hypothetical protein
VHVVLPWKGKGPLARDWQFSPSNSHGSAISGKRDRCRENSRVTNPRVRGLLSDGNSVALPSQHGTFDVDQLCLIAFLGVH